MSADRPTEIGEDCLYTIGRPSPSFAYRLRARLEGRDHDAHPGAFRLLAIEDPLGATGGF